LRRKLKEKSPFAAMVWLSFCKSAFNAHDAPLPILTTKSAYAPEVLRTKREEADIRRRGETEMHQVKAMLSRPFIRAPWAVATLMAALCALALTAGC
jgi:hypothetical protein